MSTINRKDVLDAALKSVYMEATRTGAKVVEHRDCTEYWTKKLVDVESYGDMPIKRIMNGLHDGELKFKPRDWKYILFHESGSNETLLVEIKKICFYRGHHNYHIHLGAVIKDYDFGGQDSEDKGDENNHVNV